MHRSFDNVDFKVAETEYFLRRLRAHDCVFPEIDFILSAYASAARSITLSLKAVLGEAEGFASWYALHEARLRADPVARYFLELRNYTQKTGATVVNRSRSSEKLKELLALQLLGKSKHVGKKTWFGDSGEALPAAPEMEVGEAALAHFRTLLEIVYQCYVDFGPVIDPQQHYTPEHYARIRPNLQGSGLHQTGSTAVVGRLNRLVHGAGKSVLQVAGNREFLAKPEVKEGERFQRFC
jgi:hypothetical protein